MAGQTPQDTDEEKPLDPAAERVRRKLVRFMGVNLAILFAAVMAVAVALVYRTMTAEEERAATPLPETLAEAILLPAEARVLSHSVADGRLSLHVRLGDGGEAILLYDLADGREVGRIAVGRQTP